MLRRVRTAPPTPLPEQGGRHEPEAEVAAPRNDGAATVVGSRVETRRDRNDQVGALGDEQPPATVADSLRYPLPLVVLATPAARRLCCSQPSTASADVIARSATEVGHRSGSGRATTSRCQAIAIRASR